MDKLSNKRDRQYDGIARSLHIIICYKSQVFYVVHPAEKTF